MLTRNTKARLPLAFFLLLTLAGLLVSCQSAPATPVPGTLWIDTTQDLGAISPYTLGVNHGPASNFSPFSYEKAVEAGFTFMRWPGGNWGDQNDVQKIAIDNYIFEARKIGAEPSITVRVPGSTPEKAAELVRYVNVEKKYNVKYWSIGNEPNLYDNSPAYSAEREWTPESFAIRWREFATAMEAVDPNIVFYGPDTSQFIGNPESSPSEGDANDFLQEFLKVNGDMVDIVAVHRYPFPSCTNCGSPTWEEMRANTPEWDNTLPNLRRIVKEITGKDLPVAVTEYNSNWSAVAGTETSPDSFYSALWLADIYGRLVRQQPEIMTYWVVKSSSGALGLLTSYEARPSYYTFIMWKKFGSHLLPANSDTEYVSVYAAKNDDGTVTVMLINLNGQEVRKPLQLNGGKNLSLAEAYLLDATHSAESITPPAFANGGEIALPAESVTLLIFR